MYAEIGELPIGKLPKEKTVIESMVYLLRPDRASTFKRSITDASRLLSYVLMEHWNFFNIYTVTIKIIASKIEKVYLEFINNIQTRVQRRTEAWKKRWMTIIVECRIPFLI